MRAIDVAKLANVLANGNCENTDAWNELIRQARRQNGDYVDQAQSAIFEAIEGTKIQSLVSGLLFRDIASLVDGLVAVDSADHEAWMAVISEARRKQGKAGELAVGYLLDRVRGTAAEDVINELAVVLMRSSDDDRRPRRSDRGRPQGGRNQRTGSRQARGNYSRPARGSWADRNRSRGSSESDSDPDGYDEIPEEDLDQVSYA